MESNARVKRRYTKMHCNTMAEVATLFQERRGACGRHKTPIEKEVDEVLYQRCRDLKGERGIPLAKGGLQ